MPVKIGCLGKIAATVFTTVVAPLLVNFISQQIDAAKICAGGRSSPAVVREIVVATGSGATPEEAARSAVHAALLRVIVALCDPVPAPTVFRSKVEEILASSEGIILRREIRPARLEGGPRSRVYRQEVTLEVALSPLVERLHDRKEGK